MSPARCAAFTLLLGLAAAACATEKAEVDDDFSDLAGLDQKADYFSYRLKLLADLTDGATRRVLYSKTPRFRGFRFTAAEGDRIDAWVRSTQGDAVAWVLDGSFKVVAKNDDADDSTEDSHVVTTLPASPVPGTYYLVFRDYDLAKHWFKVEFDREAGSWEQEARAQVQAMVDAYSPLDPFAVAPSSMPAAARARYDAAGASNLGGNLPGTFKLSIAGRDLYLILMTDGSGEGGTVVVDLIDDGGRWFDHGIGHSFWDGDPYFSWVLEDSDPTVCQCGGAGADDFAVCDWTDGSTVPSRSLLCDPAEWEAAARAMIEAEFTAGWDLDDPRRVADPEALNVNLSHAALLSRLAAMRQAEMEYTRVYRLTLRGGDLYLVLGNVDVHVFVDLIAPLDRWFAHGTGDLTNPGSFAWTLSDGDPTVCSCAVSDPAPPMAQCSWFDGSISSSQTWECD